MPTPNWPPAGNDWPGYFTGILLRPESPGTVTAHRACGPRLAAQRWSVWDY